jgi:hypothetical protein
MGMRRPVRRDVVLSQVIDELSAQEIKETAFPSDLFSIVTLPSP